jgi:hypothetical protein
VEGEGRGVAGEEGPDTGEGAAIKIRGLFNIYYITFKNLIKLSIIPNLVLYM